MSKNTFFLSLILFFSVNASFSQYFLKENPIVFDSNELTEENISKIIREKEKVFSESDLFNIKQNISKHNMIVQAQMHHVKKMRQKLIKQQHLLTERQSISSLLNSKEDYLTNYNEISDNIEFNLQKIGRRGMFLFIKKNVNNFKESSSDLAREANKYITPLAIYDLRGSFIKSVTDFYKTDKFDNNLYKYINEEVSGEIKSLKDLNETVFTKKMYWNISVVDVLPLKGNLKTRKDDNPTQDNPNITLLNVSGGITPKLKSTLTNSGLPANQINKILNFIRENTNGINSQNIRSKQNQINLINDGQLKLKALRKKIESAERKIEETHIFLRDFLREKCNIEYSRSNFQMSVQSGKDFFTNKINDSYVVELYLQESELKEKWNEELIIRENMASEVAKSVIDLVNQLNASYGTIEQHRQVKELINDEYNSESASKRYFTGEVNKVWLYLKFTDAGAKVNLVSKFRFISNDKSSLKREEFLEDAKSYFLLDYATISSKKEGDNTSIIDDPIRIIDKEDINNPIKKDDIPNLDDDKKKMIEILNNETGKEITNKKDIEDPSIIDKMKKNDEELKQIKLAREQEKKINAEIKKYKRKRGFQRTLMFLSAAAGGYFLYDSTVAKSSYDEATNASDAVLYREKVQSSKTIAYACFGLATYNFICATRYKIKKKKAQKKLNAGFSFNTQFKGIGLTYSF